MTAAEKRAWTAWSTDSVAVKTGVSFDRSDAVANAAPAGLFRVCAYHVDHDEHPTCFTDVATLEEAVTVCTDLAAHCGWNVDFAAAFDDKGDCVHDGAPY